jgi:hypothetical protein
VRIIGDKKRLCAFCVQMYNKDGIRRVCAAVGCVSDCTHEDGGLPVCSQECADSMLKEPVVLCRMCARIGIAKSCSCPQQHCRDCCWL